MIGTDEQEINSMIESLERNSKRVDEQRIELDRLVQKLKKLTMPLRSNINNIKTMNNH